MIKKLLIYKSESFNPYHNLAVEKLLFDTLDKNTVILYLWQNKNTVVIGKNQNPWAECRCNQLEQDGGFIARRLSGGGAVFHDEGNLNFTFICENENFDIPRQLSVIRHACALTGIDAEISGRNDILASGKKFSGNAFFSSGGKSYHHGTILISSDIQKVAKYLTPPREKLLAKGVKSVNSRVISLNELANTLTPKKMAKLLTLSAEKVYSLPAEIMKKIDEQKLLSHIEFFSDWDFIFGKTIKFSSSLSSHFSWGSVELNLQIENGVIKKVLLYTDALDEDLSNLVDKALCNCKLNLDAIKNNLFLQLPHTQADDIASLIVENLF